MRPLLVALIALAACGGGGDQSPNIPPTPPPPAPVASVSVTLGVTQLVAGASTSATAVTRSNTGEALVGRDITWSSSNTAVATVSGTGTIVALTPGTTNIVASSEGQSGSAPLTVVPVPVASVTVALAASSITVGAGTVATVTLRSASNQVLTGRTVTWFTSNPSVVSVSATGTITALAEGTAIITALSEGQSGSAMLTVTGVPIASVTVSLSGQSLQIGQSATALAIARDAAGNVITGRPINWSSTSPFVASVNATGGVTALAEGSTVISATIDGRIGSAVLQVSAVGAASVTLNPTAITMLAGDLRLVVATVRDGAGRVLTGRQVSWFTSNNTIVDGAVRGDTAIITGLRPGTVTVSVEVDGRTASIPVLVQAPAGNVCTTIAGASVIGHDGRYLGRFTNRFESESVLNEFGTFGSRFAANSTNNQFGTYGSQYSSLSARNPFTSTPPRIVRNGSFLAYYTVNESLTPRVAPAYALTCNFP